MSSFQHFPAHVARFLIMALFLVGCTSVSGKASDPSPDIAMTQTFSEALAIAMRSFPTETPTPTPLPPTATSTATVTPTATPTIIRTPPALPTVFTSDRIDPVSIPQTYIKDTCQYLKARWDEKNSPPGTVVMVVMFHSITEDSNPLASDGSQVHHIDMVRFLEHAKETGFETITTTQLADFLTANTFIPKRSLVIIVDDRKRKEYYEKHFIPFLEKFHWTITNAWISAPDTPDYLWKENEEVVSAGWVDPQAHGVIHNIPAGNYSSDEFLRNEFNGSVDAIEKHFGKRPIAYIWPGGGFTQRSVALAQESGYRIGFTTNPRGPVMFNWVPQAEQESPQHTSWLPEIPAGNPLMTLPRYWSSDAAYRIDDVINVGKQAEAQAAKDKATELEYYDIMCKK